MGRLAGSGAVTAVLSSQAPGLHQGSFHVAQLFFNLVPDDLCFLSVVQKREAIPLSLP